MKKLQLSLFNIDFYLYELSLSFLCRYNSINVSLSSYNKNTYINNTLYLLYNITLGLILCCPFLFIGLILATLNIDILNIFDNNSVFMEGNSGDSSGNPSGNPFGNSGGSSGPSGGGGPSGENNNLAPSSTSNNSNNTGENRQHTYRDYSYTEDITEQDMLIKECMTRKINNYRVANAHTTEIYLDDSFTPAEHEYIADKIFEARAGKIARNELYNADLYARHVVGFYPDRRYYGKVTRYFLAAVFL